MARKRALAGVVAVGLLVASCSSSPATPESMTVAAYDFDENRLIAEIYAVVLENAGIEVERKYDYLTREVISQDFAEQVVDLVPEYLGSVTEAANLAINGEDAEPLASGDIDATAAALQDLVEPYDVVVGDPAEANNEPQFAVRKEFAEKNKLSTVGDLAALNGKLTFGGPKACETAAFCLPGLEETYGVTFKKFVPLDTGGPDTLNSLEVGDIDVGMVFDSDPAVDERGFIVLIDNKNLQTTGNIVPLFSREIASEDVLALIASIEAVLTTEELRAAHGQVSIEGYPPEWVAANWAASKGLIPAEAVPATPTPTPPPSPTPPPPPPEPEPEPEPASAPTNSGGSSSGGGGGYSRNAGEPSANAVSRNWPALAQCESGGNPSIVSSNGLYHGLYQFSVPTWQAVGGSGAASSASANEQTYRAQILYDRAGPGQWPVCGRNL